VSTACSVLHEFISTFFCTPRLLHLPSLRIGSLFCSTLGTPAPFSKLGGVLRKLSVLRAHAPGYPFKRPCVHSLREVVFILHLSRKLGFYIAKIKGLLLSGVAPHIFLSTSQPFFRVRSRAFFYPPLRISNLLSG
jgi:hypothetical protein